MGKKGSSRPKRRQSSTSKRRVKKRKAAPKINYHSAQIRSLWKESTRQTESGFRKVYQKVSLETDPNNSFSSSVLLHPLSKTPVEIPDDIDEVTDIPDEDKLKNQQVANLLDVPEPAPPQPKHLSRSQIAQCRRLMRRHGANYQTMSIDHKRNRYQLSTGQLRKMFDTFWDVYATPEEKQKYLAPTS